MPTQEPGNDAYKPMRDRSIMSRTQIASDAAIIPEKLRPNRLRGDGVREDYCRYPTNLGTVIFMWVPSHVGITPNVIADNVAAQEQEVTPEGMVTGLISKQVKSRPIIYHRRVMGRTELADNPIYQEARKR
eukprot:1324895-Pleurochrysis_carterae.AAC.1